MRSLALIVCLIPPAMLAQSIGPGNEEERLAKWKPVEMPFRSAGLSARERQMIEKLVEACRYADSIYWRQSDLGGLALYKATRNPTIKALLSIMGSRWDLLDENRPFIGEVPQPNRAG